MPEKQWRKPWFWGRSFALKEGTSRCLREAVEDDGEDGAVPFEREEVIIDA